MDNPSSPAGICTGSVLSQDGRTCPRLNRACRCWLASFSFAALFLTSASALAATAPDLGSTAPYAIVSSTFTNTSAGTTIDGDVCYTTAPAVAPFVSGATVVPCPAATGTDQNAARADLDSQICTSIGAAVALNDISIGGGTPGEFPPGCYSSTGAMSITAGTAVTLSGTGVYIFRPGGALDPGANSNVVTAGNVCLNDVFWAPVGATTIGANANFIGNIFRGTADGLSITFGDSSSLIGRALAYGSTVTTANATIGIAGDCLAPPPITDRATFRVIKDFTDGNPMEIEVTLACFTGLPLIQSTNISETRDVEFVVTSFDEGELDCDVTEEPLTGYSPAFTAGATTGQGLASDDLEGCYFDDVVSGQFVCLIDNTPDLVDIEIEKLWVFEGSDGSQTDTSYKLTLYCDAIIEEGQEYCQGGGENGGYQSCKILNGDGSAVFVVQARPDFPSSQCWVRETVYDSSVEVDNDCESIVISAGVGASCLITNTVFFEGIPTLGQTGLAILALLMLSVGLVGFRRLA